MTRTYADTTALFEYHAGRSATRTEARRLLQPGPDLASSDHVEREWKRIIFKAAVDLLEALDQEPDLAAVLSRLGSGFGRSASQRLLVLALLCGKSQSIDVNHIKIRARQMLRGDMERLYHRTVGTSRHTSRCGLAREKPRPGKNGQWEMRTTCIRREGICDHEARIGRDLTRWKAGAAALRKSDRDDLRKMGKLAEQMAASPQLRTGVTTFGRTGDLAIALDCESDELMVTTDRSFDLLGPAMGFSVHRITATAAAKQP